MEGGQLSGLMYADHHAAQQFIFMVDSTFRSTSEHGASEDAWIISVRLTNSGRTRYLCPGPKMHDAKRIQDIHAKMLALTNESE